MQLSVKFLTTLIAGVTLSLAVPASSSAQQPDSTPQAAPQTPIQSGSNTAPRREGRRGPGERGFGGFPGGARGILGTVTEVATDHYTIKTDQGDLFTVHFSVNTRIMKQPPGPRNSNGSNGSGSRARWPRDSDSGDGGFSDADRQVPPSLKPSEIKVGDIITAGGEVDNAAKSIGAMFVLQIDPERARQMREMQANYGKTWLAGRITAIDGTKITIDGMIDHAAHAIEVDENTSFRKRRDSITLADIQPGDQLRADGAVKAGVFLATTVNSIPTPSGNAPPIPLSAQPSNQPGISQPH